MTVTSKEIVHPRPCVVVDIDGVLCDFVLGFTRLASTVFNIKPFATHKQLKWKDFGSLSYADTGLLWDKIDSSPNWWETLPPLESHESDSGWLTLLSEFATIHYVTNRYAPSNVGEQTRHWLDIYGFPAGDVHVVREKAQYVQKEFPNLIGAIDDSPYNIEKYVELGLPLYVRDWTYNRLVCIETPRVESVKDFSRIIIGKINDC